MNYQHLITCQQLLAILDAPNVVILDASIPPVGNIAKPLDAWPNSALPNARRFDLDKDFSDHSATYPHTMISEQIFEQKAQALGINKDSQIVVYDNLGLFSAARAWWMFKSMGHHNIAVLDGGLPVWLAAGFDVYPAKSEATLHGNFVASAQANYFKSSNEVLHSIEDKNTIVVDARASDRFKGLVAEPRKGVRSGHIPGSANVPYASLFNDKLIKPSDELKQIWQQVASIDSSLVFSCGSGVTACILALSASLCGYKKLSVYDGSWSEWGSEPQLPIEKN